MAEYEKSVRAVEKLDKITSALKKADKKGMADFEAGLDRLTASMKELNAAGTDFFNGFTENMEALSAAWAVNVDRMSEETDRMKQMMQEACGSVGDSMKQMNELSAAAQICLPDANGYADVEGMQNFLAGLEEAMTWIILIGDTFGTLERMSGGLKATGTVIEELIPVLSKFAGPAAIAVSLIMAIGFAMEDLLKTSGTFQESAEEAFEEMSGTMKNVSDKIEDAVKPLGDKLKELGEAFYDFYEKSCLKKIVEVIATLMISLQNLQASALIEILGSTISGVAETIGGVVGIISGVMDVLTGLFTFDVDKIKEGFGEIGAGILEALNGIGEQVFGWIDDVFGESILEKIFNFENAFAFFEEAKKSFENALESQNFMDVGAWIMEGILDGFVGALTFITEPVANFFSYIWEVICNVFGIHSPAVQMQPLGENILLGIVEGFSQSVSAFWDAVNTWFENDVKPWFSKETWSFGGIKDGLSEAWNSAVEAVKGIWNRFAGWLNKKLTIHIDTGSLIGKGISEILGTNQIRLGNIPTFASGGFPNTGQLFLARENGIAEMVGQMGGRVAVANNDQITYGITSAVYPAVYHAVEDALIRQKNIQSGDMVVQIDGKEVFRATRKEAQNYFKINGASPFPV